MILRQLWKAKKGAAQVIWQLHYAGRPRSFIFIVAAPMTGSTVLLRADGGVLVANKSTICRHH